MTFNDLKLRVRALLRPNRVEQELDEELAFHIEREARKLIDEGMPPAEARVRAQARFGSTTLAADQCREWAPAQRNENYLKELEKIYKGVRASFIRARFMDWPGDPWVKASYSFPAPGQVTSQGPTLRQGIGRLHFAGEHTCYAFMGYMEGALNSGAAAAKRIAGRDGYVKDNAA